MNRIKKIGAVIVITILNILLLGIIPLNVLLIWKDFPQWIMIIASATVLAIVLFIAKKAFAGKASKIITVVLTSVFAAMCILLAYACPYWNSDGYKLSSGSVRYYENSDLTRKEALDKLEEIAVMVGEKLEGVEGLTDIDNGLTKTTPEYKMIVDKTEAASYGLSVAQVYQEVNKKLAEKATATLFSCLR